MRKTRVAVLMGGPSSEHEISLQTGEQILQNLDRKKFEVFPVKIEKNGQWPITMQELKERSDVAFIAMHGEYGEDGQVQSLLEIFDIPYTGSDPVASALAMDKYKTAAVLKANRILTPKIFKKPRFPLVVKPSNLGSSVGVAIVHQVSEVEPAIQNAMRYSSSVMLQQYIKGRELACGVLEINKVSLALLPTEIIPKKSDFFDYASKYEIGGAEEVTPPDLPKEIVKLIQQTALRVHAAFGCSGMSRTDFILDEKGKLYVLELNTIPGLTKTSLFPQQTKKLGFNFPSLLEIIIQSGLNKRI
jgi:D-alanine-D-alanine ligase